MVAEQRDDEDEEQDAEGGPQELVVGGGVAGGGRVEALDEDQAEPVEQDGDGEHEGVGVRGPEPDGEVREQRGRGEADGVAVGRVGNAAGGRQADVEVTEYGDQDGAREERQLDPLRLGAPAWGGGGGEGSATFAVRAVIPRNVASWRMVCPLMS